VAFIDTNLDGSFEDEMPLHDYRQGREMIALGTKPLTIVANFSEADSTLCSTSSSTRPVTARTSRESPRLQPVRCGGIQRRGARCADHRPQDRQQRARRRHGPRSMMRAIDYAGRFAAQRNLPLVLNMSFGVGNEHEGRAVIDSVVDTFLLAHPEAVFAISAGNDGPGWSTLGFPGSANLALSVGAVFPGVFTGPPRQGVPPARDVLGWFSSRGGELAKPDIVTPGVAFSSVPRWDTGNEIKPGTSMSSPHAAGLAACLVSALTQEGRRATSADIVQALRMSVGGSTGLASSMMARGCRCLRRRTSGSKAATRARSMPSKRPPVSPPLSGATVLPVPRIASKRLRSAIWAGSARPSSPCAPTSPG